MTASAHPDRKRTALVATVVVAGYLGAGCGDGHTARSAAATTTTSLAATTTTMITRARFVQQANAICADMNRQSDAIADPGSDPFKTADAIDAQAAIVRATLERLRALPIPPGDENAVHDIYTRVETLLRDMADLSQSLRAGNQTRAQHLSDLADADGAAADAASRTYGLDECANDEGPDTQS